MMTTNNPESPHPTAAEVAAARERLTDLVMLGPRLTYSGVPVSAQLIADIRTLLTAPAGARGGETDDERDAARYRCIRERLRDEKWSNLPEALAQLRPDPDDPQTKYVDNVVLDYAIDAARTPASGAPSHG